MSRTTTPGEVDEAVAILKRGGLVAIPTETVYGLAADAENELAVRKIFAVKGRPSSHPLIVHVESLDAARSWVSNFGPEALALAAKFWPGPLTLVLKRSSKALDAITGGQDTVAVRVPAHPLTLELLRAFGGGLAAPSANKFGRVSPTAAAHVYEELGDEVELILDGGPCAVGVESTIVDCAHGAPRLLRPGGAAVEELEAVLGQKLQKPTAEVRAPGMLESHYAPHAGLVLTAYENLAEEANKRHLWGAEVAVLCAEPPPLPAGVRHAPLPKEPAEAARVLYAKLRELDHLGVDVVIATLPDAKGLGLAVRDRLTRAAAPREKK